MKYFLWLLFLIQIQNCESQTNTNPKALSNKEGKVNKATQENYLINSIDKIAIGEKLKNRIK